MFETLKRLWREDKLTESMLENALSKGWITAEQKAETMAQ